MLAFAPKFLGQIRLARHTSLGQKGKTVQDLRDLIPKDTIKVAAPKTYSGLKVGDYVIILSTPPSEEFYGVLYRVTNVNFALKDGISRVSYDVIASRDNLEPIPATRSVYSESTIGFRDDTVEVYRPSGGGGLQSPGSNKGTLILGGLALAAIAGGAIYFATRS